LEENLQRKRLDSDGNLVNVGNSDADGANVNRNRADSSNDNLGVSLSRSLKKQKRTVVRFCFFR
jgi:hypothetical protein